MDYFKDSTVHQVQMFLNSQSYLAFQNQYYLRFSIMEPEKRGSLTLLNQVLQGSTLKKNSSPLTHHFCLISLSHRQVD